MLGPRFGPDEVNACRGVVGRSIELISANVPVITSRTVVQFRTDNSDLGRTIDISMCQVITSHYGRSVATEVSECNHFGKFGRNLSPDFKAGVRASWIGCPIWRSP